MKQAMLCGFIFIFFCACHKDDKIPLGSVKSTQADTADFTCKPYFYFQTSPRDSDINPHCVYQWMYNPINIKEILYTLTNGQLWRYNLISQQRNFLTDNCVSIFETNKKGWIVFNKLDLNVYKIKSNGDSLTLLSAGLNPHWDYTDTAIYYYTGSPSEMMIKIDSKGKRLDSLSDGGYVESYSKISNKRAYVKYTGSAFNLVVMNLSTKTETIVAQDHTISNVIFDNNDEYLYYQNDSSMFRSKITLPNAEIILKNCPNYGFGISGFSFNVNKLLLSWEKITALPPRYHECYLHEWRSFELDLSNPNFSNVTSKLREVKIYP